jgi:hypothetical protein
MSATSKLSETCGKTFCGCVVAVVVALTLLSVTAVVLVANNTSVSNMFKVLFPD